MNLPRYLQLHALLKQQILTGTLSEGSLLPSENQLSKEYSMSRSMVRQALVELEKERLIRKHQGKGSIVERKDKRLGLLSFRGFSEVLGSTDHRASSRFLQPLHKISWSEDFFFELSKKETKKGCIVIRRLREVDKEAVMLEHTYLPDTLNKFMEKEWVEDSLFKTLQFHYQISIKSVEQYIKAISADAEQALLLHMQKGDPLLKINRKYGTTKPDFFVYSTLYCNTEQYAIGSFME
ncbi:GntR family transcriptional regulator [Catalinimonas sp. 4WD22]|uniref:GntR family transcriptional regulator n=1 Tax=Catalinimonas locisalis TaxID=3133978 RepID=UPI003100EB76